MLQSSSKQIVFITGAFISNSCWDEWIVYFENEGFKCVAPAWPFKNAMAEELRNRPAADPIASNTITSLTEYFAGIINALPEKPILIGHSVGGLVAQLLLQRGMGAAAVVMRSFPPQGVNRFRFSFLKAIWETMVLFTSSRDTYMVSFRKWKYAIANGIDCDLQKELYYSYAIPESKIIIRDMFKCLTKVDFKKSHAPLLFTAGGIDKLVPPSINYSNYRNYEGCSSITSYREFKNHNHLVFGYPEWKREADFILHWLKGLK